MPNAILHPIKKCAVFLTFMSIIGCQSTTQSSSPQISHVNYKPDGHEQFILAPRTQELQKYGYTNFCLTPDPLQYCSNRLAYNDYLGKRGYFETAEPTVKNAINLYYPVVLETGERFFFKTLPFQDKYETGVGIIVPIGLHEEAKSFQPEPLFEGSNLNLLALKTFTTPSGVARHYTLDNGDTLSKKQVDSIRDFTRKFANHDHKVAELLLGMNIRHDKVENRYFITPLGGKSKSQFELYIGVNDQRKWLRFKTLYRGGSWLFANSFIVAADDYRWRSPVVSFKRDHSGGTVWEWIDTPADQQQIEFSKKMASAETPIVRFIGTKGYRDYEITIQQQQDILNILELHQRISKPN